MRTCAKFLVYVVIGSILGFMDITALNWQWWAIFIPLMFAIQIRDWAVVSEALELERKGDSNAPPR